MTGDHMRHTRERLGLSQSELADWLGLERAARAAGHMDQGAKRVREMEQGTRPISGPVGRCMQAFAAGWRPGDLDVNRPFLRIAATIDALLTESVRAAESAKGLMNAGSMTDASLATGKAAGIARACNVLSHVLAEIADVRVSEGG